MIFFSATVDGVKELSRGFNRIIDYIDDFTFVWPAATAAFYQAEIEQFGSEGSKGASGKWAPLSKSYAAFKAKKFPGKTILQASGSLYAALTSKDAAGSVFIADKKSLTIGERTGYGIFHQRGTDRMPARTPISLSLAQKRDMQKAIQLPLVAFVRKQGFNVSGAIAA